MTPDLETRAQRAAASLPGSTHHWALLHFRRGGLGEWPDLLALAPREIGYESA